MLLRSLHARNASYILNYIRYSITDCKFNNTFSRLSFLLPIGIRIVSDTLEGVYASRIRNRLRASAIHRTKRYFFIISFYDSFRIDSQDVVFLKTIGACI